MFASAEKARVVREALTSIPYITIFLKVSIGLSAWWGYATIFFCLYTFLYKKKTITNLINPIKFVLNTSKKIG